ncbi:hormone-sensitive lipase [Erpetoichthys calabaricus]|uniref:Hormone-sensitive lipase n=1 Tax=Erpetoichthys calabaricus TaxID=27687 RepID=A0A8C4T5R8_ERPCA|nr:hormone-sensitive lipase [Erpetoichthys calabaricus]XP_051776586.1 hormone-sensitive lipase [Erpetoichthys calabaricus]XP_051776587.1 hormone-sensitive lipase [Erpetoichthys calabaricus]
MDTKTMFQVLHDMLHENISFFRQQGSSETAKRFVEAFCLIQGHANSLEPMMACFSSIYHIFDFDSTTPANGYRSLMKVVRSCILHIIHKGRYVAANRCGIFFRASHNVMEIEAYCSALCQLRALVYFAQRLLTANRHGSLFFEEDRGLSEEFVKEYASLHKGCFYGRCLGFQFTPAIRPFLQTISIGLVSFGENYKRHQSGIGVAASSFFTSGKYAIDPELRGAEFERITQNLDVNFWKRFWNITETEVLASLANLASTTVRVNKALLVPPEPFELPLVADPKLKVTVAPPVAHTGPAHIQMRLLSYELREGQDSVELTNLVKPEVVPLIDLLMKSKKAPRSKNLIVHFHGGGFVAQTSKSHEPYLKSWACELGIPILSVDYSLAPEAPFPRALEECFYAYCWAVKNCHLLGSTGERICLAGDSAGGNLCLTVSMRAASYGIRMPSGIMAAYPATLLTATASPSRLLTLMDPLLPLSVLSKCLNAYAGMEPLERKEEEKLNTISMVRRDTANLLRDLRMGASAWINAFLDSGRSQSSTDSVRKSVSEAAISLPKYDCKAKTDPYTFPLKHNSIKSQTSQDLEVKWDPSSSIPGRWGSPVKPDRDFKSDDVSFFLNESPDEESEAEKETDENSSPIPSEIEQQTDNSHCVIPTTCSEQIISNEKDSVLDFPEGFKPLRSEQLADMKLQTSPIVKNPFMSPLLAPDDMLRGLPPLHIVACALDPMLDDSVMFAKRLRAIGQPVSLCVVEDLPHGFLSLSQLSRETKEAANICVNRIREIFSEETPPPSYRKHRRLERTDGFMRLTPGGVLEHRREEPIIATSQSTPDLSSREVGA